jgi:periplasmic protein TonB
MIRSSLAAAFVTSFAIHLGALVVVSLSPGLLRAPSPPNPDVAELVMVTPVPQPETPPELATMAPPSASEEEEVAIEPPSPPPRPESITPPQVEPVTPPKIVEKPEPRRAEPRPKSPPPPKPARLKKSVPPKSPEPEPVPSGLTEMADAGGANPGPRIPRPDDAQGAAVGNVPGPPSEPKAEERPPKPVEGGEAGAGNLFDKGDVGVVPGSGVAGGGGGRGRGGRGLGEAGDGPRVGGIRPGPGGEGSGEGIDGATRPLGGYQVIPRYPESARRQGIEGTVLVKALVTEQGRVEAVKVERSAGHTDLDQAALEAVSRWRFEPARRGRQPVAVWVLVPVEFTLRR